MRCPFLREAQVKYCQGSAIRKMIVRMPNDPGHERCSSKEYKKCPSLKQHHEENPQQARCPFLQESLMQYCAASSITKYVPYSESSIIRCGNDGHRYCDLFLSFATPNTTGASKGSAQKDLGDDIRLPVDLAYSTNHMWLDRAEDGTCHIGVDEFLTSIFCKIEAVNFLPSNSSLLPTVVFTVQGVDLQLVFPVPVNVTRMNSYIRADIQKLLSHPYSAGWLYEGTLAERNSSESMTPVSPLLRGERAVKWMKGEVDHLSDFIHDQIIPDQETGHPMMMDGGVVHPEFIDHLSKQELLQLFNEFFSPYANWRKIK
jgi:glycine cleavage system H lipoate-binding protein